MTIQDRYRRIRNQVRRLGRRDSLYVVWAYAQYLQVNDFEFPSDIEVSDQFRRAEIPQGIIPEWTLEQLAREVIRHAGEEADRGRSLRQWGTMAELVTQLRDLEEAIYVAHGGPERIHLEIMRIAHRQFVWQQQRLNWRWIIRYYKLFNTVQIASICSAATGLSVDQIYLIGMAYLGNSLRNYRSLERLNIQIPGLDQGHFDRFLGFTSLTHFELSNRLREEHTLNEGYAYRYSSLREFPMVRIAYAGQREVICAIPTLLFWRMTTGLYYSLRPNGGFPTAFGQSFQAYVGQVLAARITNPDLAVLGEMEYRVGRHRKHTIDFIIRQGEEVALFAECKTMRLTWASKAGLTDLTAMDQDIRKLAGAVVQVYRTIQEYREGHYPNLPFAAARQVFPAVVTLEDWYFFGHDLPDRLERAVRTALVAGDLPEAWVQDMPYSIFSIDEFESASGVINAVGLRNFISGKVNNPELRRWAYDGYCKTYYMNELAALPRLFRNEYDAMFAGLAQQAQHQGR